VAQTLQQAARDVESRHHASPHEKDDTHAMSEATDRLRQQLIRNFDDIEKTREERAPLYDTLCARLGRGTAATKLGISIDIVEPGKRGCPYHFHYAQEEAFVILEGAGSLRVAGEMLALKAGDTVFIPPGPAYPHQIVNTSDAPLKFLSISTKDSPRWSSTRIPASTSRRRRATASHTASPACTARRTISTTGTANPDRAAGASPPAYADSEEGLQAGLRAPRISACTSCVPS
jgi:uncharacterized cupin superfamily protein